MDKNVTQILYKEGDNLDSHDDCVDVKEILAKVHASLKEKGYNSVNQIVQYIMSGEPLFITSHNGARSLITKIERDELVEELVKTYIKTNFE